MAHAARELAVLDAQRVAGHSYAGVRWRKVAMIISEVLFEFERAGTRTSEDQFRIADRIQALVEAGELQAEGDVSLWRHSEVRLPNERSRGSSAGGETAEERLVFVFFDDTVFSFERAHEHSLSLFGGPMEYELSGIAHGPKPLHMIARLSAVDLRGPKRPLFDIPLIHGMCYEGCEIEYRVDGDHVEIRRMSPTESSDALSALPRTAAVRSAQARRDLPLQLH
jgi:hypothetical protein